MRRLHFFELHEQSWYPKLFRSMFRKFIGLFVQKSNALKNVVPLLSDFLIKTNTSSLIDLCSGSGDVICLLKELHQQNHRLTKKLKVYISDLYPDIASYEILKAKATKDIFYYTAPVNVLDLPENIPRIRTIINSLHHFTPLQVKKILVDATINSNGIAIIEVTSRNWQSILFTLFSIFITPLAGAFLLRPFRLYHVFFSILVPVLPLTVLFDGVVSCLRTYTNDELIDIISSSGCESFKWDIGRVPSLGFKGLDVQYLFGYRKNYKHNEEK